MTHLLFFEKPGCGGNARQRAVLLSAGHTLDRRNLLTAHWTRESLLAFLGRLPVAEWFNRAAPRVKSGEVQPEAQSVDSAIDLLLEQPLLIRRPLMQRTDNQSRFVGFDTAAVDAWIGLGTNPASPSLEGCASPTERCARPTEGAPHAHV
jgi:nitrogenase-associated protein